ncbi:MAG: QueT transporter family protein [Clostridia bacterium]|nr:QueT transporter family protein [Clostridia bacterium]
MKRFSTKQVAFCGLIAALYVIFTWILGDFAYGPIQFRIAECMTVLPFFYPISTIGLTLGCFLANLLSTAGPMDLLFGTVATLLGALGTQLCRKKNLWFLAPLPPVLSNALLIGLMLTLYGGNLSFGYFLTMAAQVGISEAICCFLLGGGLIFLLRRHQNNNERGIDL